jgi:hypothetical protein
MMPMRELVRMLIALRVYITTASTASYAKRATFCAHETSTHTTILMTSQRRGAHTVAIAYYSYSKEQSNTKSVHSVP